MSKILLLLVVFTVTIFISSTESKVRGVPLNCTGPNEFYACGTACDTKCVKQRCTIINVKCNDMCYCKQGYARDDRNVCIPINQCRRNITVRGEPLNCTGPNEIYACGSACDTKCATLNQRCTIMNVRCNDMCYCEQGYARDDRNVCIPINQCRRNITGTV